MNSAERFEERNGLRRGASGDTDTAENGDKFEEVVINKQMYREDAVHKLDVCLDGFIDTARVRKNKDFKIVYWRIMPEISQSQERPHSWRGYARLALG